MPSIRIQFYSAIIVTLCCAASTVWADSQTDAVKAITKAITSAYSRVDAAAQAKSVSGTLAIDAVDYKLMGPKGKTLFQNGPKMKARYQATYESAQEIRQRTNLQKLTLKNGLAIATILQHLEMGAKDPKINYNWRTSIVDWKMEDIWTHTSSGWKRKSTRVLNQSTSTRIGPVQ